MILGFYNKGLCQIKRQVPKNENAGRIQVKKKYDKLWNISEISGKPTLSGLNTERRSVLTRVVRCCPLICLGPDALQIELKAWTI